jgi:predicted porin
MNKNIKLAVAGAVLALSATANAGIIIPAGDWTIDLNGNVNAFAIFGKSKGNAAGNVVTGGLATVQDASGEDRTQGINTGLLPAWLGVTGSTRQNDVDTSFTISFQPGVSHNSGAGSSSTNVEYRQAFLTFGDKSWGSFKLGKDLGIFASDAILNDMTLLGVGSLAPAATVNTSPASGGTTTLGGIGTGYIYAAWKGQIAYTTPNFNGFQATVGITNPNQASAATEVSVADALYQDRFGLEGKASYSFSADNFTGKVWVGGATYDVKTTSAVSYTATAADLGANFNAGGFGLTGYYYKGEGAGTTFFAANGATSAGAKRDSDGGYIQATYILPTKTKLGLAYGISSLDLANGDTAAASNNLVKDNERMTVGLYHPLTKHLNLVAEYSNIEAKAHSGRKNENNIGSLGAILFF